MSIDQSKDVRGIVFQKCQASGIHTAVDTSGYGMDHEGYKVLEEADLLLYDLKGMDPLEHMSNTGVSNERILNNLKRLAGMNKPIIISPSCQGIMTHNKASEVWRSFCLN